MRNHRFHLVRATNILCFGPEGITIHFGDYGNIVQVQGMNLDVPGTGSGPASNGSGKSSIQELLSIGLYGRTVKSPTKNKGNQIINVLANKGEVEVQWDDYRVVRTFTRSKSGTINCKVSLWQSADRIWDDKSKITRGGPEKTQEKIEEEIGLTHHSFCNVVIFDDSRFYAFLGAPLPTKREIVENLLDLDQYKQYFKNAKDILKELRDKASSLTKEYERSKLSLAEYEARLTAAKNHETLWRTSKQNELLKLYTTIKAKQEELQSSNSGEELLNWQNAQDRISTLHDDITDLESKKQKLTEAINSARLKYEAVRKERAGFDLAIQSGKNAILMMKKDLDKATTLVSNLEGLKEGTQCPVCHGTIRRENYGDVLTHSRHMASEQHLAIKKELESLKSHEESINSKTKAIQAMDQKLKEAEGKIADLDSKVRRHRLEISQLMQIPKPDGTSAEKVLEVEIVELKKQYKAKKEELDGHSPYKEIVDQAQSDLDVKQSEVETKGAEITEVEADIPYIEFWVEAFGDNGIRKYVIDGIIPALNARIAHWLQILIDGVIQVALDNKLEEEITRSGNPAVYTNMSNGEIQRINLAISQSFAYVRMLNSGSCPSVVFTDEITGGGIDRAGIPGVYNMIFELAKERQVFVTTHNENLIGLLQGCDTITLKKHNDVSTLV